MPTYTPVFSCIILLYLYSVHMISTTEYSSIHMQYLPLVFTIGLPLALLCPDVLLYYHVISYCCMIHIIRQHSIHAVTASPFATNPKRTHAHALKHAVAVS